MDAITRAIRRKVTDMSGKVTDMSQTISLTDMSEMISLDTIIERFQGLQIPRFTSGEEKKHFISRVSGVTCVLLNRHIGQVYTSYEMHGIDVDLNNISEAVRMLTGIKIKFNFKQYDLRVTARIQNRRTGGWQTVAEWVDSEG